MAEPWAEGSVPLNAGRPDPTLDLGDDQVEDAKRLASFICGAPGGTATLLAFTPAGDRGGLPTNTESARRGSLYAHTLLSSDLLVVSDASTDPRFADHSSVVGPPYVRFFAGVPLVTPDGERLGVVSVVDSVQHELSEGQRDSLRALGRQLTRALEAAQGAQTLSSREEQQTAVAQLGVTALTGLPLALLLDQATSLVCEVLNVDMCGFLVAEPETGQLRLEAGSGWNTGTVGAATFPFTGSFAGAVFSSGQPVIVTDIRSERRFSPPPTLRDHDVVSGLGVVIQGPHGASGALIAHTRHRREFTYDDVVFLQLVANTISGAIMRSEGEQQVRHQALHDALTELPNRALLLDRLQQYFARARRSGQEIAALFIDLDDFKPVNDTLGHEAGDELLVAFADRLRALTRPSDTISRLAGDEFVLIIEEPDGSEVAEAVAERVLSMLTEPFRLTLGVVSVSASIGIALGSTAGDPETLLRNADAAMYQAKRSGSGKCAIFDESLHTRHLQHLQLKQSLRGAIERHEMSVVYQPVVDVSTGALQGVEALLRWAHPELGPIPPTEFIGLAEDSGLIVPIGRWVLEEACRAAARWNVAGHPPILVHVNLSRRQLADPGLVAATAETLRETGAKPWNIGFEITESALLDDIEGALVTLQALKDLGVHLAMDDFGTGYSSLAFLKRMPVDLVKIDRSFVDGLGANANDSAIVAAVVRMAEALGLSVTAEGVENLGQLAQLKTLGCSMAQGFYFAHPLPMQEMDDLLAADGNQHIIVLPEIVGAALPGQAGLPAIPGGTGLPAVIR